MAAVWKILETSALSLTTSRVIGSLFDHICNHFFTVAWGVTSRLSERYSFFLFTLTKFFTHGGWFHVTSYLRPPPFYLLTIMCNAGQCASPCRQLLIFRGCLLESSLLSGIHFYKRVALNGTVSMAWMHSFWMRKHNSHNQHVSPARGLIQNVIKNTRLFHDKKTNKQITIFKCSLLIICEFYTK